MEFTQLNSFIEFTDKQGYQFHNGYWYNIEYEGMVFTTQDLIKLFIKHLKNGSVPKVYN